MSLCILNRFTVNTNGGNLMRMCYSETRQGYLIIKLVIIVYRWNENLPLEWNKIILLPFLSEVITLFHYSPEGKKRAYQKASFVCFLRKQGYHVTNFARETKVSSYKCWRWKNKIITFASSTYKLIQNERNST